MTENLHEGHRERVRQEFLNNGFNENTPPHKILELLLFYCINRIDTNPIAHEMINKYGTLADVLDAPIEELAAFNGMSERAAILLKLIMPISRRYVYDKSQKKPSFKSFDDIGEFAAKRFTGIVNEKAAVITFDGKGGLIDMEFIAEGDISSVGLSMRDLILACIDKNAVACVLVHNHPNGIAIPSGGDVALTEMAAETLRAISVKLVDHIIIGDSDFVSMAQSFEYSHIFTKR